MCYFELDDPAVEYNVERNEAAAAWTCDVCGAEIPPGAWCRTDAMLLEYSDPEEGETDADEWETFEVCFACDAVMDSFADSHGSTPAPNWFAEALWQCFEGADKADPEVKEWRDGYAGIRRRQRAAKREAAAHG
ncbi:MAG: hypothetical protein Q8K32_31270 [Archangium sp.]|nr:hypothetical protein [Archangium sp.]